MPSFLVILSLAALLSAPVRQPDAARTGPEAAAAERFLALALRISRTAGSEARFTSHCAAADRALETYARLLTQRATPDDVQQRLLGNARALRDSLRASAPARRASAVRAFELGAQTLAATYLLDRARARRQRVALLLTTSVSCACTLELCGKLEAMLSAVRASSPGVTIVVADGFHRPDLQTRYGAGFLPTLLLLAADGKEYKRFESTALTTAEWSAEYARFVSSTR